MSRHPIEPRPVRPGTLAVRQDTTNRGRKGWAILSNEPLTGYGLFGWKRGFGESHVGLYAYRFVRRESALRQAHRVINSEPSWEVDE